MSRFARFCSEALGKPYSFILALIFVIAWAITGPVFDFNTTWQLVINTTTTILTFLFMFLLQHTQNADTKAMHLKIDELILSNQEADNRLVAAEKLPSMEEIEHIHEEALDMSEELS